jgi:cyanophycinase
MRVRVLVLCAAVAFCHTGSFQGVGVGVKEARGQGGMKVAAAIVPRTSADVNPAQAPSTPTPKTRVFQPRGTLVMAGGALRFDNNAVWSRIISAAGEYARQKGLSPGERPKIAVFATASSNAQKTGERIIAVLQKFGAAAFLAPVALGGFPVDYQTAVIDPRVVAQVEASHGVFFSGGDQARLVSALRLPDGAPTDVLRAIYRIYSEGGAVAGTSAGAAVMSKVMCRDARHLVSVLRRGVTKGKEVDDGFGFLDANWFVDQHFLARGRFARALVVMHEFGVRYGMGVDEDSAVIVSRGLAEIAGYRGALLIDMSDAKHDAQMGAFNLANVRLSYLERGDRLELSTLKVTPSPAKRAEEQINPNSASFKPAYDEPIFANDILANSTLLTVMKRLMESKQSEALGIAFDGNEAKNGPTQGFEFRFSRTPETVAWWTGESGGDDWTIKGMRLDVRPVTMRGKLYEPR